MAVFRINLVRQQWQTVAASRPSGQAGEQFGKIVLTADTQRRVVHFAHYQAVRKLFFPAFVEEALAQFLRRDCAERSEEHTSELQSLAYLVCRLLLEKKKISGY